MASQKARKPAEFALYQYLHNPKAKTVIGGSATPYLSLDSITKLSNDSETTRKIFSDILSTPLALTAEQGSKALRESIASTYDTSSGITLDNIIAVNATTGANHIVLRSLLSPNDHAIVQYPAYGPLIEEPIDIGCDISYLRLDPSKNWSVDLRQLETLIRPGKTKIIVLNNPVNPTGTHIDNESQREIIKIAKEHDIHIHCDEIFRPLFYTSESAKTASLVEHPDLDYDRVSVSSSLSKVYGLSGTRVGWITTRSPELYKRFLNYRMYSVHALSMVDEIIATEALGPRCRMAILNKHISTAQVNLDIIAKFIEKYSKQCEWTRPTCGAVAFIKLKDFKTGEAIDDVDFCNRLVEKKGVLLAPATLCFAFDEPVSDNGVDGKEGMKVGLKAHDFRGRVRLHFTCPTERLEAGLKGLGEFLAEEAEGAEEETNGASKGMSIRGSGSSRMVV